MNAVKQKLNAKTVIFVNEDKAIWQVRKDSQDYLDAMNVYYVLPLGADDVGVEHYKIVGKKSE